MIDFEWDENKAKTNLDKHGISFQEATTIFSDIAEVSFIDPKHSSLFEVRSKRIGRSERGQILAVIFTQRGFIQGSILVRIISARPASRRERRIYGNR